MKRRMMDHNLFHLSIPSSQFIPNPNPNPISQNHLYPIRKSVVILLFKYVYNRFFTFFQKLSKSTLYEHCLDGCTTKTFDKFKSMDLIVHTAGGTIQSVSGVNETTTCAQIVYALAHATQQKGRFSLIARLAGSGSQEHRFTPNERPFDFIRECSQRGLHPEFELRRLEDDTALEKILANEGGDPETLNRLSANSSSTTLAELTGLNNSRCGSVDHTGTQNRNRPPPPDYNAVMTERCNSLRRGSSASQAVKKQPNPLTFLNIPNFSLQDLYTHNFSRIDLETLVDNQQKTLAAQKSELVRVELTLLDSKERKLIQLKKQHNNLQTVLNSLRNGNWFSILEAEKAEGERLNTAITAMRTAVAEKQRELSEAVNLQMTLERQLANELGRAASETTGLGKENGH